MAPTSEKAKDIANDLYKRFGTDSGIVFGIPSGCRSAVEWVIEFVIDETEEKKTTQPKNYTFTVKDADIVITAESYLGALHKLSQLTLAPGEWTPFGTEEANKQREKENE